ncbi:MAG: SH3 domain-containing protein [Chloroflexota bacterium]|nr:SH3 domain-containing protein [Chloroflexota bacterium]MDE2946044.1 SH3 domain-containing protein [Chloroflexota bacterium]
MLSGSRKLLTRARLLAILGALFISANFAPALASVCTLADHIRAANTNTAVGFCPAGTSHDVITITEDITLSEALPPITGTITIEGGGHTISGADQFRIFDVDGGVLTIKNLTLTEGNAPAAENGGALRLGLGAQVAAESVRFSENSGFQGGAISTSDDDARLSVRNSEFLHNMSRSYGGAIFAEGGIIDITRSSFQNNQADYYGGAIAAHAGRMSISSSTFAGNLAYGGGAVEVFVAEVTLTHVTMMNNLARHTHGNAIHRTAGVVNLRNSIVGGLKGCTGRLTEARGNLSQDGSCALLETKNDPMLGELTGSPAWYPLLDGSPALDAADARYCAETDQIGTPRPQGGGCDIGAIESMTAIPAPTAAPIICTLHDQIIAANTDKAYNDCPAGNGADTILMIRDYNHSEPLPTITSEITIEGNGYTISGSGTYPIFDVERGVLSIKNVTLANSRAVSGGAIRLREGARVEADQVTFRDNSAESGGAIAILSDSASATINNSSFINNSSQEYGGAIYVLHGSVAVTNSSFVSNRTKTFGGGALHSEYGSIAVSNSTFYGNAAAEGGALNVHFGSAILTHVTMLDNAATQTSGDAIVNHDGSVILRNSIVHSKRAAGDCDGGLTESAGNLSPDGSCALRASAIPLLDELTGSPAWYPLLDGSPALDAADARYCAETDQIGTPRPQGGGCDIGAIESRTASPAAPTPAPAVCSFYDQIIAANSDRPAGRCPAGSGADTITLSQDITLSSRLPEITSGLTIEGNGFSISGDGKFRIFDVRGGRLTLNNLTVRDGWVGQNVQGGAVRVGTGGRLNVNNSSFINNSSGGNGGAIWMEFDSYSLTINSSRFIGNVASYSGSAIGSYLAYDRAILISNSSFIDNGGLYDGGAINAGNDVRLDIANSSFSNNQTYAGGSALDVSDWAKVTLTHLTFVDNRTTTTGSSIRRGQGNNRGWLRLRNSIIAGSDSDPHCPDGLTENSGNLFADGSCPSSANGDPMLGVLTGALSHHSPQDGSPAIDAADPRFCLATDQRGRPRPQGAGCDIGAIESGAAPSELPPAGADKPRSANCLVTTTLNLNFRDGPNGVRIGLVPGGSTLQIKDRAPGWFKVEYRGESGWISADYVRAEGDCG